ncbi:HLA class II histocompatibility antigen, DR alpha chain-like [Oenanthe melanoleuca]|uniref:HLA class II histocompatibility antigen, DR alpha chain-like n=1 Tax=Oenanthe melanoleuca TaxID=2939378 RepID=UPI0024C1481F|nr:HLA class II histocompatibility antigen, DR alpha chain-like [Oenanthe melanoleuca]
MTTHALRSPIRRAVFGVLLPSLPVPPVRRRFTGGSTDRSQRRDRMDGARSLPRLLLLLALAPVWGVPAQHSITQTEFYQKTLDGQFQSEQFMFDFDGDEIFHVQHEQTVWRLPHFQRFASFEAQGALQNIAIDRQNLQSSMRAYNNSRAPTAAPESGVFPKHPAQQDEPNVLICWARRFWPPVLGLRWLRNGVPQEQGVMETPFYPDRDNSFQKFSYLPFIPRPGEYYDCQVEHEGLKEPRLVHWEPQLRAPASEAAQTAICALGLAVGIAGIGAGTALAIRGARLARARRGEL